ncbi:unnamed protein product [Nyctereutes procyonoides]|uniref:(raccoon dog) hypothetical protein n=1 Tax=Nyctereutes procyonoides TaxID=34880 RepID=A0A811Y9E2_NYCPR|nr:unnamed protein product [Nyctereutes procyonoides]
MASEASRGREWADPETQGLGADSQTVVTQEPSLSVSPGGTVTLTCGLSSGSVSTSNYPSWYQQNQGRAPRMLIYSISSHPSGVPDCFSGSISGKKAALTITGAQPEDESNYYCSLYMGSTFTQLCTSMGRRSQNLLMGSEKLSFKGRRESEMRKSQHHHGK